MVAMWMKKSFQVWTDSLGGSTSSMGNSAEGKFGACSLMQVPLMTIIPSRMACHGLWVGGLLAGRDFVFLDHVVEHLIDG